MQFGSFSRIAAPSKVAARDGKQKAGKVSAQASADEEVWKGWSSVLKALDGERFYFRAATRGTMWTVEYAGPCPRARP